MLAVDAGLDADAEPGVEEKADVRKGSAEKSNGESLDVQEHVSG